MATLIGVASLAYVAACVLYLIYHALTKRAALRGWTNGYEAGHAVAFDAGWRACAREVRRLDADRRDIQGMIARDQDAEARRRRITDTVMRSINQDEWVQWGNDLRVNRWR